MKRNVLQLTLQENAIDSLTTAIEYYFDTGKPTAWKHTVMLTAHAVEIFLKARLAEDDPHLIFRNKRSGYTVGFDEAIKRLNAIGVVLSEDEIADIKAIRAARDNLEHAALRIDNDELDGFLVRAMRFLDDFLPNELDINLRDIVGDRDRLSDFYDALYSAKERLERAEAAAEEKVPYWKVKDGGQYEVVPCTECFNNTVAIGDDIGAPVCEYCGRTFERVNYCPNCGTAVLDEDEDDAGVCEDCWDRALSED